MTDNNCNCGCGQTEQMRCINAKSDFDFILRLYDAEHEVIGMPEYDWEAQLYTSSRLNAFIVSSKDGVLTNCWNDNDSIHVVCDNHGLSPGQLFIEFTGYLPNDQYEDGTQKIVLRRSMPIKLMRTNAEPPDTFDMELMFPYIKGDKGDPGQDGKDGQDGKSLTYADMTEEEKNDLAKRIAVDIETAAGTPDLTGYVTEEELQAALDALPTTEIPTHKTINGENVAIPINADGTFSYSQNGVLTRVNSMFQSCDNIITLDISNLDLSNVPNVAFMFASCSKLQKLYMCDIDTGKIGNMNDLMFSGCNALNHIRCRRTFRDWCWANQDDIMLPTAMRSGGSGTWELVD